MHFEQLQTRAMRVGELARATGAKVETIRYYDREEPQQIPLVGEIGTSCRHERTDFACCAKGTETISQLETMLEKPTILVCDDDEMLVELLLHRLETRGFRVLVARDGGEAMAMAEEERPDAIVLDSMMPVMNGEQVLRQFRSRVENSGVPVIMLTARRQERDILGALELGANEYLTKPFIPEELITRLNRLLGAGR